MDRYEVPINDHLAPLVEAVERGDEVVIMREGLEVVRLEAAKIEPPRSSKPMSMMESLERFRQATRHLGLPKMTAGEAAQLVRDMRDEGY